MSALVLLQTHRFFGGAEAALQAGRLAVGAPRAFAVRFPTCPCSLSEKSLFAGPPAAREDRGKCRSFSMEAARWVRRILQIPAKFPANRELSGNIECFVWALGGELRSKQPI